MGTPTEARPTVAVQGLAHKNPNRNPTQRYHIEDHNRHPIFRHQENQHGNPISTPNLHSDQNIARKKTTSKTIRTRSMAEHALDYGDEIFN